MTGPRDRRPPRGAPGRAALSTLLAGVLAACAVTTPTPAPSPSVSVRPSGPLPIRVGTAERGATYTTTLFEPTLTFTVPSDGWLFFFQDDDDELAIGRSGDVELIGGRVSQVVDPTSQEAVGAPDDLIAWFGQHPGLTVTDPGAATIVGRAARSVDVSNLGDEDVDVYAYPTGNVRVVAGTRARIWVVPLDGADLVFSGLAPADQFEVALPELEAMVASMRLADP